MRAARAQGRLQSFGGLQVVSEPRPPRRGERDRQRDRPERRRQDDALQPDHRRLRARTRARSASTGESHRRPAAAPDQPARHRPHVPDAAPVPEHDGEGERDGGRVRTHAGRRRSARCCARRACGARSARSTALAEERLVVLRRAADGLPLEPARLLALVREPPPARDRAGDGDAAPAAPARRARRRDEPGRDARDHRADRQAPRRRAATRSS